MTKKRKIALGIYALIIIIVLIFIIFFAPESWFSKDYSDYEIPTSNVEEPKEVDYETQKTNLTNNKYHYTYNIMDSMTEHTYTYECSGAVNIDEDKGFCSIPSRIDYETDTKKEVFKYINIDLLNPEYIFNLVKDITPEEINNQPYIDYIYKLQIQDLNSEILIRSGKENISEIIITNAYMQYHLKFSDINVWQLLNPLLLYENDGRENNGRR